MWCCTCTDIDTSDTKQTCIYEAELKISVESLYGKKKTKKKQEKDFLLLKWKLPFFFLFNPRRLNDADIYFP